MPPLLLALTPALAKVKIDKTRRRPDLPHSSARDHVELGYPVKYRALPPCAVVADVTPASLLLFYHG